MYVGMSNPLLALSNNDDIASGSIVGSQLPGSARNRDKNPYANPINKIQDVVEYVSNFF